MEINLLNPIHVSVKKRVVRRQKVISAMIIILLLSCWGGMEVVLTYQDGVIGRLNSRQKDFKSVMELTARQEKIQQKIAQLTNLTEGIGKEKMPIGPMALRVVDIAYSGSAFTNIRFYRVDYKEGWRISLQGLVPQSKRAAFLGQQIQSQFPQASNVAISTSFDDSGVVGFVMDLDLPKVEQTNELIK